MDQPPNLPPPKRHLMNISILSRVTCRPQQFLRFAPLGLVLGVAAPTVVTGTTSAATNSGSITFISGPTEPSPGAGPLPPVSTVATGTTSPSELSSSFRYPGPMKRTPRQTFFFPTNFPALWAPLPEPPKDEPSPTAVQLRPYLAEPFFPALGALVHEDKLSERRQQMLERYQELKQQVVKDLSAEMAALESAPAKIRQARLEAFAQGQAISVAQVEALAEEIRSDLLQVRLFGDYADWEHSRTWTIGDPDRKNSPEAQFQVLQAAAAFSPGLLPEQRGLLKEAAQEVAERAQAAAHPEQDRTSTLFYFSPSNSRVRLPADLPATLQATIDEYRNLKDELKGELRSTVFAHDRSSQSTRNDAYTKLGEAQAPRLARLSALAESIRVGLVGRALPDEPLISPIPENLAPQITDYLKAKVQAQRAFVAKLAEVRAALPQVEAEIVPYERGYRIQVGAANAPAAGDAPVLQTLPEFHDIQARRYEELVAMKKALVRSLKAATGQPLKTTGRTVDELLQQFSSAQKQRENSDKYWLYRQAVLEPGLSDGQRRLLFASAIESIVAPYVW